MKRTLLSAIAVMLLTGAAASAGPITITFDNSPQPGLAGTTVTFNATFINASSDTQYLNGDGFTLVAPFLLTHIDDTDFFLSWPLSIAAGDSFGSAALFTLSLPGSLPSGHYTQYFNLMGGTSPGDLNLLATAQFELDATGTAVPEPGTLPLLIAASVLALCFRRRSGRCVS